MGRHTETVNYVYGTGSEKSFGQLLIEVLSFPPDEIAEDYRRAVEAGVIVGTTPERVEKAKAAKARADTGQRLREQKRRAA
jgi:hypothetical protein